VTDQELAVSALLLSELVGQADLNGEEFWIDGILAADRRGMTEEWVRAVRAVADEIDIDLGEQ
jgi:hypothetical protein